MIRRPCAANVQKATQFLSPARKMWIDLGDVGDRTKKDRPEAVSTKRSHPVLAGLIALAVPLRGERGLR